jgi:hypothetical protein
MVPDYYFAAKLFFMILLSLTLYKYDKNDIQLQSFRNSRAIIALLTKSN